jgi:hypothetical protein
MNVTISTPEIYGLKVPQAGDARNDIVVDMEYIPFHDVSHIILEHDKAIHEWLIESAIAVVDYELTQSTTMALKDALPEFHSKAESIKKALPKSSLLDEAEIKVMTEQIDQLLEHFAALPDLQVPVGACHGDLTFQNMLIDPVNRELCVFDFLDSFLVGSPGSVPKSATNNISGVTSPRHRKTPPRLPAPLVPNPNPNPGQRSCTRRNNTRRLLRPYLRRILQIRILGCRPPFRILLSSSNPTLHDHPNREAMYHGWFAESCRGYRLTLRES